eukprot:gene3667-4013_t
MKKLKFCCRCLVAVLLAAWPRQLDAFRVPPTRLAARGCSLSRLPSPSPAPASVTALRNFLHDALGVTRTVHWGGGGKRQSRGPKKVSQWAPAWLRRAVRVLWFWSLGWLVALLQRVFRSKGDDYPDRARQETLSSLKALAEQDKIEEKLTGAHDDVIVVNASPPPPPAAAAAAAADPKPTTAGAVAAVSRKTFPFLGSAKAVRKEEDLQSARKAVERKLKEIEDRRLASKAPATNTNTDTVSNTVSNSVSSTVAVAVAASRPVPVPIPDPYDPGPPPPPPLPPVPPPPVRAPQSARSPSVSYDAAASVSHGPDHATLPPPPPPPAPSALQTSAIESTVEKAKRVVADAALLETFPEVVSGKTADPFYLVHETGPVDRFAVSAEENRTVLESLLSSSSSSSSLPSLPALSFGAVDRLDWQGSWEKVRSLGRAGFVSYVLVEVLFWAMYPLALWTYQQATGLQSLEYLDSQDVTAIVGAGAFFLAVARLAVPLRFALALAMAPAVEDHLLQPFDELRGLNSETPSKS